MKLLKTVTPLCVCLYAVGVAVSSLSGVRGADLHKPAVSRAATARGCQAFVQSFYTWYTGLKPEPLEETALRQRSRSFAPELLRALKEDAEAAAKSPGETVGVDFDPFVNAQELCAEYVAGAARPRGKSYFVDVYGVTDGRKAAKPTVVAELQQLNGKWVFVNFHYGKSQFPANENLVGILKVLRQGRQKSRSI